MTYAGSSGLRRAAYAVPLWDYAAGSRVVATAGGVGLGTLPAGLVLVCNGDGGPVLVQVAGVGELVVEGRDDRPLVLQAPTAATVQALEADSEVIVMPAIGYPAAPVALGARHLVLPTEARRLEVVR